MEFGITNEAYVVNCYSAGGSVTTIFDTERHGWGDGSGTAAAGWPDRAAAFLEQL